MSIFPVPTQEGTEGCRDRTRPPDRDGSGPRHWVRCTRDPRDQEPGSLPVEPGMRRLRVPSRDLSRFLVPTLDRPECIVGTGPPTPKGGPSRPPCEGTTLGSRGRPLRTTVRTATAVSHMNVGVEEPPVRNPPVFSTLPEVKSLRLTGPVTPDLPSHQPRVHPSVRVYPKAVE